jgi:hypothetical protein
MAFKGLYRGIQGVAGGMWAWTPSTHVIKPQNRLSHRKKGEGLTDPRKPYHPAMRRYDGPGSCQDRLRVPGLRSVLCGGRQHAALARPLAAPCLCWQNPDGRGGPEVAREVTDNPFCRHLKRCLSSTASYPFKDHARSGRAQVQPQCHADRGVPHQRRERTLMLAGTGEVTTQKTPK